jgi:hypothetical protein
MDASQRNIAQRYCINATTLSLPASRPSWFTAQLDEIIKESAGDNRFFQLPSFYNAASIGIFSDYGGSHAKSRFDTYAFLFADFNGLSAFDQKVKALRTAKNLLPTREISFKELHQGSVKAVVPDLLRAADMIPGLLFTLAVEKTVDSIISGEPNIAKTLQSELRLHGFQSWQKPKEVERLLRIVHSVAYWLSLMARPGMKTFWMSDHDSIHGSSNFPSEFDSFYARTLVRFGVPLPEIIGTAKPFAVEREQPVFHEAISITDLVAGAISACFTEKRGVQQSVKHHESIGDIVTLLGHQSPFLKKVTYVIQRRGDDVVSGLASVTSTTRSTDGYIVFDC